ncbi:hypothetical protein SIM91_43065 [Rhodococcus opacus]|uniref:hypothetical protein n=1 Tax=Rhodococcus opacus TaxID=37919 RepID=UPI000ADD00B8|nr:hypothetical protein [Rhodococcus opacus]MDX5969951.1 hypothetical protein [Rhodococcus opacus]NKY76725.1 hypothetical protein [Rhodococcus opacus]CAG7632099.1 hypothetical protein E143388_07366 [Rhodococcus opacus]
MSSAAGTPGCRSNRDDPGGGVLVHRTGQLRHPYTDRIEQAIEVPLDGYEVLPH